MTDEHLAQTCAELDQENARLHGELIDVRCELATARAQLKRVERILTDLLVTDGEMP